MTSLWMVTTNYPPVGGGVSRYNAGLVASSQGEIAVAGQNGFAAPPAGEGVIARLAQTLWAWKVARSLPPSATVLASPPHLGLGVLVSGRQFVQFIHGGEWESYPFGGYMLKMLLKRARFVVVNSEATRDRWLSVEIFHKVMVLRPGLPEITPVISRPAHTASTGQGSSPVFRVVSVARLSVRKGFERLIRAVRLLSDSGVAIELTIVGSGHMESSLREIADGDPCVIFEIGLSDEQLLGAYDMADLFALVPREVSGGEAWEGFGIVYLEAAARGLPILATNSGGIPEAISAEGAVMLPEQCTETDIAQALRELMEDPTRLAAMSTANTEWALANVWASRELIIQRILALSAAGTS